MIEFLRSRKHIALFVMSGFMLTAGSNTGESAYLFLPGDNMTYLNQVIQGTESFIADSKVRGDSLYPLWEKNSHQMVIHSEGPDLYVGAFLAYQQIAEKATGVSFVPGDSPQLVVLLSNEIKNWSDVDASLKRGNINYKIPELMKTKPFSGCSFAIFPSKGQIGGAVVLINTSNGTAAVLSCMYHQVISILGFVPTNLNNDISYDLVAISALYRLDLKSRNVNEINAALVRTMTGHQ